MLTDEDFDIFDQDDYDRTPLPRQHVNQNDDNAPVKPESLPPGVISSQFTPLDIKEKHFSSEIKGEINKAVLKQELQNADIYLKNAHKMFQYCTTIGSFNSLLRNCLLVSKQRRASIEHAMKLKPDGDAGGIEVDPVTGEVIRR